MKVYAAGSVKCVGAKERKFLCRGLGGSLYHCAGKVSDKVHGASGPKVELGVQLPSRAGFLMECWSVRHKSYNEFFEGKVDALKNGFDVNPHIPHKPSKILQS